MGPARSTGDLRQLARGIVIVDLDEFERAVAEARDAHPQWFALPSDESPGDEQVAAQQAQLGAQLPQEYLDFVRVFGGGDFAFLAVYSLDEGSDLNIVTRNAEPWLSRSDFVAISDNGAGDYYGFAVQDGRCSPEVLLLDHESGELRPTGHADFFEFALAKGLRQ